MTITYLKGSATRPVGDGPKIIAHICNDIGGWGRGFVLAVSRDHPAAETAYRSWYQANPEWVDELDEMALGEVQFVKTGPDTTVANMISQKGIFSKNGKPPIRYSALSSCLAVVSGEAEYIGASVHMPRIGCGLAGGSWEEVEQVIQNTLVATGIPVFVYDYEADGPEVIPWNR